MIDHVNTHCLELPYADRYFFDNGFCVGHKDPHNRIELFPHNKRYPSLNFEMPRQKYELDKVLEMMQHAYERGKLDNKTKLASLLKELIAL